MKKPNYIAKKSAWSAVTFFRVIFFWLIIPFIKMIVDIVKAKNYSIEFYDDYVVQKSGVLSKKEKRSAMVGIIGVSISKTFAQRLTNRGDIYFDVVGKWDISTYDIVNPDGLKAYLETLIEKVSKSECVFVN